jgi:hypothetical protein
MPHAQSYMPTSASATNIAFAQPLQADYVTAIADLFSPIPCQNVKASVPSTVIENPSHTSLPFSVHIYV